MKPDRLHLLSHTTLLLSLVMTLSCNHKKNSPGSVDTKPQGYVLKADEGELLPDIAAIVKTSPETGSKNLMTVVTKMNPGTGTGLHYHKNADEVFYVIEGKGTAVLGDSTYNIEEGDLIFIPKNTDHKVRKNDSTGFLKVLFFLDNPELLKSFREEHQQFYIEKKPKSLETLNKISEKYGTYNKTKD
jgi:quercetin dioxygenase-like cupin family protein